MQKKTLVKSLTPKAYTWDYTQIGVHAEKLHGSYRNWMNIRNESQLQMINWMVHKNALQSR